MSQPLRVFLSYSVHDKPAARDMFRRLRGETWLEPWLDEENLLPGQDWRLETEKAIRAADAVLILISSRSVSQEGNVQRELKLALDVSEEKPEGAVFLIPVRLEDCAMPHRLRDLKPLDAFPADRKDWAYERILASLRLRAGTGQSPTPDAKPSPEPQPTQPAGNIHVTVYGDVTGNLVIGDENQATVIKKEKPKE
ncbi:MAG TPA: toll/interleukin-1 receptor domain-containing protein [Anaerolineales bacterium]|nr:toll/interleukin-1 receptor domain-containing protein [Anaerolineales bacterium]